MWKLERKKNTLNWSTGFYGKVIKFNMNSTMVCNIIITHRNLVMLQSDGMNKSMSPVKVYSVIYSLVCLYRCAIDLTDRPYPVAHFCSYMNVQCSYRLTVVLLKRIGNIYTKLDALDQKDQFLFWRWWKDRDK